VALKTGPYSKLEDASQAMIQEAADRREYYFRTSGLTMAGLRANSKNPEDTFDDYEKYLSSKVDYTEAHPIPSFMEMLIKLKQESRNQLILLTNSGAIHTERTLRQLGIYSLFDYIVFTDYQDPGIVTKPYPTVYLHVQHAIGQADPS